MTAETFLDQFSQTFAPAPFGRLARETSWQQRTGKIEPFEFVASLVFAQLSALRLSLNAQGQGLSEPVTPQALDQRYHERAVAFFAAAYTHCLRESLAQPPPAPLAAALRTHFTSVVLFDSTAMDLPPALATLFPGCGGAAGGRVGALGQRLFQLGRPGPDRAGRRVFSDAAAPLGERLDRERGRRVGG